jgi:gliding motility-associated-like protein
VTDDCGNSINVTQLIVINDITPPVFAAPPADVTVECAADVPAMTNLGWTDNCDGAGVVAGSDVSDLGSCPETITRTWTYTDACGNVASVSQTITVDDTTPPIALCQNITVQLDGTGNASITAMDIDNGSSDNCSIASMTLDISSFTCSDIGPNAVTLTIGDACGNQSTCFATVTVEDNIVPDITCPGDVAVTAVAGNCSTVVNNIAPGSVIGNCSSLVSYRFEGATSGSGISDASGSAFNKGLTTVWYKIEDMNGNADSCSFNVNVLTTVVPPDNAFSDRAEVCAGDGNIQLSYSGGVMLEGGTARWYDDVALTNNIGNGNGLVIPAPVLTSTYYIRFEGNCDTTSTASTTVTVKSLTVDPVSASVNRNPVCAGDGSIILSYTGGDLGSNGSAVWYEDPTLTSVVGTGNDLSIAAPVLTSNYYLRFEADCDTSAAVTVAVNVWPLPVPVFSEKYENVCINGPLYRYVASGFAGSTYTWSIVGGTIVNDFNDTIYVDWGDQELTGTLEIVETSQEGCISVPVSMQIEVGGPDLDLGDNVGTCRGTSVTINPGGQFASYLWHDGSTASQYTTDHEEWVILEVSDNFACGARDSVYVTVYELPQVNLGPDTTVCTDEGLLLDAGSDGVSYLWSTGEVSQRIAVYNNGDQEIWVEVENSNGCIGGDTILIEACQDKYNINPPTAITPNGDGVNDVWNIYDLQHFSQAVVEIFDQWGTLVWKSEPGYSRQWDGNTMEGKAVPVDSYHYVIHFNDGSDKQYVSFVTVIR